MAALIYANLGSGSSGNGAVIAWSEGDRRRAVLVDLGLSPRRTRAGLASLGLEPTQVAAAVLTHLDHDHYGARWARSLVARGIPVHVHVRHRREALERGVPDACLAAFEDRFTLGGTFEVEAILADHDDVGSTALRLDGLGRRIGLATDLGRVPDRLLERFVGLDLLGLESNYCPRLQASSDRPEFLKRRITGGAGHLSNDEALDAAREIAARSDLQHLVLLHLSRQCNRPDLVRTIFERGLPELADRIAIADPREIVGPLDIDRGQARVSTGSSRSGSEAGSRPASAASCIERQRSLW